MPSYEPTAPPTGVQEKTEALMERVAPGQPGVLATNVVTRTATVEAVDPAKRVVTLKLDDGVNVDRAVAPDVDLKRVKSGDRVSVKEIASVAVFVSPRALAKPPAERSVVVETAEPGQKPARLTVDTEEISAIVESIDHATRTLGLRNPDDGSTSKVQVDSRAKIDTIEVGDQLTLRLTKAVVLGVETPR